MLSSNLTIILYFSIDVITRYLAVISGLGFGSDSEDALSLQMLTDLITGELGSTQVPHIV